MAEWNKPAMAAKRPHRFRLGGVAGEYLPNHLLIRMSADAKLLASDGVDLAHASTFEHEYWHFLQNVTTVAGYRLFAFSQQLVALFSRTLNEDGSSRGSETLQPEERRLLGELCAMRDAHDGDVGPELDREPTHLWLTSVQESSISAL